MAETNTTKKEPEKKPVENKAETKTESKPTEPATTPSPTDTATPPVLTPPTVPAQPAGQAQAPAQQKSHLWAWILGGCFGIVIIFLIGLGVLGWLAVREAKKGLQQFQPGIQGVQNNVDQLNKEAQEWQKKSEQMRNNLPADLQNMNINGDFQGNGNFPMDTGYPIQE